MSLSGHPSAAIRVNSKTTGTSEGSEQRLISWFPEAVVGEADPKQDAHARLPGRLDLALVEKEVRSYRECKLVDERKQQFMNHVVS